ncbi:MAG: hypothetical protein QOJ49_1141 [Actinomycetota bacterium]|nr:hypothetical protein [Actinomycetota bacterium]
MPVAVTAALAGALALGAYAGSVALLLAVLITQATIIARWHKSLDVPGALGGAVLAGTAGLAADLLVALRDDPRPLTGLTGVLGLAVLGAFLHQLSRRGDRDGVTASLTATVALVVLTVFTALYLAAAKTRGDAALVAVVVLSVLAARLAEQVRVPALRRAALAVLAGAVVGAAGGRLAGDLGVGVGLALGAAAAIATGIASVVTRGLPRAVMTTVAALPLAVAGPVAYVLGRVLIG